MYILLLLGAHIDVVISSRNVRTTQVKKKQPQEEQLPEEQPPEGQPPEDLGTWGMMIIWIPKQTNPCIHAEDLEDNNALDLWMTVLRSALLRWHLLPKLSKIGNVVKTMQGRISCIVFVLIFLVKGLKMTSTIKTSIHCFQAQVFKACVATCARRCTKK